MSNMNVQNNGIMSVAEKWDLGANNSIQLLFAIMNLELSESSKTQAKTHMDSISKSQEEQKQVAALLQEARQLQNNAKNGTGNCSGDKNASYMPAAMQKYMDDNKLAYDKTGNDNRHNKDEWEVAIKSLQAHQEQIGTNTQQLMVLVQDFIGQYNAYLQGANKSITDANQTLQSIIGR